MANWIRIFSRLGLATKVLPMLVILCFPIIGSRSIGGSLGSGSGTVAGAGGILVTFDPPPSDHEPGPQPSDNQEGESISTLLTGTKGDDGGGGESSSIGNPCALVSMSLLDGKDGKLMSYEEKTLISVSHDIFDVSHGITTNIVYKVDVEVPSGHEFSLEYWMNGVSEERTRLKRRHQRDHRDILELYLNSSSSSSSKGTPEQMIFCSRSSLGGQNKDSSSKVLSFNWFVNGNNIVVPQSTAVNDLPTSIVFRLRFRSIVEASSSVFEQNISVVVRPDCYLVFRVYETGKLTLNSLLNAQIDNKGLNCTILLLPKTNFGLELRIANFSIYGMRDICKGRYITFTQSKHKGISESPKELSNEFPIPSQLSPLERKFCGKLEDYSVDERLLSFPSESSYSQSTVQPSSPSSSNIDGSLWGHSDTKTITPNQGVLLQVTLPNVVKSREAFTLELISLSPCQRLTLTDLDGEMKYSKNYENDECSIVIHVPYGNKIITKMTLGKLKSVGTDDLSASAAIPENTERETPGEPGSESNSVNEESDNNLGGESGSSNNSINYYNYNDSDLEVESGESVDNSVPRTSYECPVNLDTKTSSRSVEGDDGENAIDEKHYMLIRAFDIVSGSEFTWCFDESLNSQSKHKRAWKSSGNKVKINFMLKYFDVFHLTYHSVKIPEITRDCDTGWVSMENGCVILVEKASSWTSAEETCQMKGGHLLTINSEAQEQRIQQIITESALFHPSRAYWIGANDRESEGNFQWASGLPFSYKNWFTGWSHKRNEIVNAQPNDDGWSGQDCVEIRQIFNPSSSHSDKTASSVFLGTSHSFEANQLYNIWPHSRFYWNDRNCEVHNFYVCEKTKEKKHVEIPCNRTIQLSPLQTPSLLTLTSPAYPGSYPDNIVCLTVIETVPGYRIVLSFDEFILEESPSCQYDALEISETHVEIDSKGKPKNQTITTAKRFCGDWTKKLKLLRYISTASTTELRLKFESDFSHHFIGFKAKAWLEKDASEQCTDQQMKKFGSHCYLAVSFPAVNWVTAQQICTSVQGKLASVSSMDEWNFLGQTLTSTLGYDKKTTFWIGGSIDQNSQLVWSDRMPFNFSAFHPSDLQTISEWKCLRIYWHDGGRGDFAWRLADCNHLSGYVCKKKAQADTGHKASRASSGTGGKQSSPNYPSNYYNNLDYTYHLIAPRGTQIVIRFSHFDIEDQDDCLYDYVEIIDRKTKNSTRYCGSYSSSELSKLDYVSTWNEVDVVFHTDFSETHTGFEYAWRAVDVTSCISGKTILTGLSGSGFPIHDASIHTPNFPHFNLPNLDCVYTIVAPAGQRIWLSFPVFELGQNYNYLGEECKEEDHISIDLGTELKDDVETLDGSDKNNIILCGNLTSSSYKTSFISTREKLRIRVFSPNGKSGRGFLGTFKAISGRLVETLTVATNPNATLWLTSINFPLSPPENSNITVAFTSPPNYVLTININGTSNCPKALRSYLEIRDPYHGSNGTTWRLCQLDETGSNNVHEGIRAVKDNENGDNADNNKMGRNEISHESLQMNTAISFRSTFNRLDIRQVYLAGFHGKKWNAKIITSLDENFRAKVLADGDRLLRLDGCINSPCTNGGSCVSERGKHICRCPAPFTGPFCGLSLCDLNPCLFGDCILGEKSIKCVCQLGYGGEKCDRRMKPCDDNPCSGHGDCVEVNRTSHKCLCHAWWEGPQCESRMLVIPYKPLSQRMLEEPFWLGLITVTVVLGVIGLIWCLKRHFPEKLEKLLNEDLDKNRGISWVSGRSASSFRAGGGSSLGMREPIPGTSQTAISPPPSRSFLGRFGIRKPSLLSLSSATSNVSVAAVSPHSYENRTFSLDDLLRPSRGMMRTPSPHRRRNYSVQVRRDPAEKQQILQQLVSAGGSTSLDGENKPSTPKPTLAEIIQMSERRLRLASASSMHGEQGSVVGAELSPSRPAETVETSFTTNANNASSSTPASKAEKKVTFARMLDKLAASEMTSSSSCSDVSCAEDSKMVVVAPKPTTKKDRKGRFRRSKTYHRGRNSETDQDCMDMSSSDTTPDPICPPKFPTRLCLSPTGLGTSSGSNANNSLTANAKGSNAKIPKIGSADSLLALFRRISGSNSAPPSPQYSENEESSAGATPLSTPSSPRNSLLSIRPPAFLITTAPEPNNTIELPVIDPFAQSQCWRSPPSSSITLEVPMRDYCLSPIHEVPTPIGTPSHSPCHTPMMRRSSCENLPSIKIQQSSEEDDGSSRSSSTQSSSSGSSSSSSSSSSSGSNNKKNSPPRQLNIPKIAISVDEEDLEEMDAKENSPEGKDEPDNDSKDDKRAPHTSVTGESEVIPDVLIHVPPDACVESHPGAEHSSLGETEKQTPTSSRVRTKPPPLIFANEILSCGTKSTEDDDQNVHTVIPVVSIEDATPVIEKIPSFPSYYDTYSGEKTPQCEAPPFQITVRPYGKDCPLAPPMITINQSSEAESDSDTPAHRHIHRPNLCFLSPFAGASDRVPSESNLSTSGYSSMASPCPSRCPSVSPLCPSETEDYHPCRHSHNQNHHRRSSLTPGTPKKLPITTPRRSSLNAPQLASGLLCDNSDKFETDNSKESKDQVEVETDSAVEVETDVDCLANMSEIENPPLTPLAQKQNLSSISDEMRCFNSLLQVPKKGVPKSRSFDINALGANNSQSSQNDGNNPLSSGRFDRKGYLKALGPSLDSKLNTMDSSMMGSNGVTIVFPLSSSISSLSGRKNSANLIEIPEEKERKLSPVSSRSESPLSELSAAGCFNFFGSPLTDSDGVYDCGSSEVPANNNETDTAIGSRVSLLSLNRLNPIRRSSGRKRERRMPKHNYTSTVAPAITMNSNEINQEQAILSTPEASTISTSKKQPSRESSNDTSIFFVQSSHLDLPPNLARENTLPITVVTKRASPKRRVRAPTVFDATSSSSESLASSRPRSRASATSQNSRDPSRNSSPLPSSQGTFATASPSEKVLEGRRPCNPSFSNSQSPIAQSTTPLSHIGSPEDGISLKSTTQTSQDRTNPSEMESSKSLEAMSSRPSESATTSVRPKISRLRTISHQIRFLRRLELSLIRKKECLTRVSAGIPETDRRDSILSRSDSAEDSSRCDTSDSTSLSSEASSDCSNGLQSTEKPLLSASSSSTGGAGAKSKRGHKRGKRKVTTLNALENITARDFLTSHKRRMRKYK